MFLQLWRRQEFQDDRRENKQWDLNNGFSNKLIIKLKLNKARCKDKKSTLLMVSLALQLEIHFSFIIRELSFSTITQIFIPIPFESNDLL